MVGTPAWYRNPTEGNPNWVEVYTRETTATKEEEATTTNANTNTDTTAETDMDTEYGSLEILGTLTGKCSR